MNCSFVFVMYQYSRGLDFLCEEQNGRLSNNLGFLPRMIEEIIRASGRGLSPLIASKQTLRIECTSFDVSEFQSQGALTAPGVVADFFQDKIIYFCVDQDR